MTEAQLPPPHPPGPAARPATRPRWALIGVVVAVAVAVTIGAVIALTGGDDGDDGDSGGGCAPSLAGRLDGATYVLGADLERARAAGYDDDGSYEEMVDAVLELGVLIDPITERTAAVSGFELDPDAAGFAPSDVRCWADTGQEALLRGAFDADRIAAADAPRDLALDGDVLAATLDRPARRLLGRSDDAAPAAMRAAVGALDDAGAHSFAAVEGRGDVRWAGLGIAAGDDGGDLEVVVVWAYADEDDAEDDLAGLRRRLDDGALDETMRVDDDELERDGEVTVLVGELVAQPTRWNEPLQRFDPALLGD